ncbi:hypothetical protein FB561_6072 [Kribbella amoyensis]|uniref:Restriction endonuclease type II-like domain-containing protein n=1 Tax=Kribbella amoyensis TaxID=996641 RepID=A0A561C118_9ACTN|nr:hypothetical protein [Kribbella amoyensis]TWD84876.1 hypothetical protein FB561_6072 [Kribbella amoyensis]
MFPCDLPLYFAGLPFTKRQIGSKLPWLLGAGEIRRVVGDVYVDTRVPDSPALRAAAAAKAIPAGAVACGELAAWVHGIDTTALGRSSSARGRSSAGRSPRREPPADADAVRLEFVREGADVVDLGDLRVSSPVATGVQLAMQLPRPFALSAVDAMLRAGTVDRWALRAASAAYDGQPGIRQAREILRYADRRAASPGESWLRLRLIDAGFGRPEAQYRVAGARREYRIDLAYPEPVDDGQQLGLEYDSDAWHSRDRDQQRDDLRRQELEELGWHLLSVRRPDLWGSYPALELAVGSFLGRHPRLPRRW